MEVVPTTDPTAPPTEVELEVEYVGVGADAVSVQIQMCVTMNGLISTQALISVASFQNVRAR